MSESESCWTARTQINEDISIWLLCPHALQGIHVHASALQQRVAVIRLDCQGLQALCLQLPRGQGRVGVHRAGLGVAGTGHDVTITALGTRASQKVVVSNPSAAVVRNAAVAAQGRVRGTDSPHVVLSL